jgi:TatD DNase family protein
MALVRHHMALAAELQRPVSMHCVRAFGHAADFFRALEPADCPPKVCCRCSPE